MAKLSEITEFLDRYLDLDAVTDGSWNGLQFEGEEEVKMIGFAVDACVDSFNMASEKGCQMLFVHHGLFWKGLDPSLKGALGERVKVLGKSNLSFYCAHLPLDRHKEVGNNAQLLKLLGAEITGEFLDSEGKNISWIGEFLSPISFGEIEQIIRDKIQNDLKIFHFGKKLIKTAAVCSGGGGYSGFSEARDLGVDLYISGDAVEVYQSAKDAKMNVIFAGHYATETLGLKALMEVVKERFEVEVEFLDLPTGL